MRAASATPPQRLKIHCLNLGILSPDLEIAIQHTNAFFSTGSSVGLNNVGDFFLTGKWPSGMKKLSNFDVAEFAIVVHPSGVITEIQERDQKNPFRGHKTHPLIQDNLTVLLETWVNEQIEKSSDRSMKSQPLKTSSPEPSFAITMRDGCCIGLSILDGIKNLPNGVHVLYALQAPNIPNTEKSHLTHLEELPQPTKTTE